MVWVLLAAAIAAEVAGTVSLRLSDGFTRPVPSLLVVVGYVAAFLLLGQVLRQGMAIGIAYGIWAACGVALVALIGALFLHEPLTGIQIAGLGAVIAGVVALEAGGAH